MGGVIHDREHLAAYLFGELSEPEQHEIEQEYLADDSAFERLLVVEDELAYDYVEGRLSQARRDRFEITIGATDRGRANLAFARSLLNALRASQPARPSSTMYWVAGIAAAVFVAIPVVWLARDVARLQTENASIHAQLDRRTATPTPAPIEVSLALTPGRTRSGGATTRLEMPAAADRLHLELIAPANTPPGDYVVAIRGESDADLWSRSAALSGRAWIVDVPSKLLAPGDYQVLVRRIAADSAAVADFSFRLIRK